MRKRRLQFADANKFFTSMVMTLTRKKGVTWCIGNVDFQPCPSLSLYPGIGQYYDSMLMMKHGTIPNCAQFHTLKGTMILPEFSGEALHQAARPIKGGRKTILLEMCCGDARCTRIWIQMFGKPDHLILIEAQERRREVAQFQLQCEVEWITDLRDFCPNEWMDALRETLQQGQFSINIVAGQPCQGHVSTTTNTRLELDIEEWFDVRSCLVIHVFGAISTINGRLAESDCIFDLLEDIPMTEHFAAFWIRLFGGACYCYNSQDLGTMKRKRYWLSNVPIGPTITTWAWNIENLMPEHLWRPFGTGPWQGVLQSKMGRRTQVCYQRKEWLVNKADTQESINRLVLECGFSTDDVQPSDPWTSFSLTTFSEHFEMVGCLHQRIFLPCVDSRDRLLGLWPGGTWMPGIEPLERFDSQGESIDQSIFRGILDRVQKDGSRQLHARLTLFFLAGVVLLIHAYGMFTEQLKDGRPSGAYIEQMILDFLHGTQIFHPEIECCLRGYELQWTPLFLEVCDPLICCVYCGTCHVGEMEWLEHSDNEHAICAVLRILKVVRVGTLLADFDSTIDTMGGGGKRYRNSQWKNNKWQGYAERKRWHGSHHDSKNERYDKPQRSSSPGLGRTIVKGMIDGLTEFIADSTAAVCSSAVEFAKEGVAKAKEWNTPKKVTNATSGDDDPKDPKFEMLMQKMESLEKFVSKTGNAQRHQPRAVKEILDSRHSWTRWMRWRRVLPTSSVSPLRIY